MGLDNFRSSGEKNNSSNIGNNTNKGGPKTTPKEARDKYQDKEWLTNKIKEERNTRKEVANELGVSRETIQKWCERFNIESAVINRQVELIGDDLDVIIGNLMGDASIISPKDNTGKYQHSDTYSEYLEFLTDRLPSIFDTNVKERKDQDIYYIRSLHTKQLYKIRQEWYTEDGKTLPYTFKINGDILKYWYICDGTLEKDSRPSIAAKWLNDNSFSRIINQLDKMGIPKNCITIKEVRNRDVKSIRFKNGAIKPFFKYIGSCPVDCYSYKWP